MRLADILAGCQYELSTSDEVEAVLDTDISGIAYDSRKVQVDGLFIAVRGGRFNGHDFIGEAINRGAVAVVRESTLTDDSSEARKADRTATTPVLIAANDTRMALACVSNNFYRRPSERVSVIGVTGTNGKTTTTYLVKSILETWSRSVGLIGTITHSIGDRLFPALHTTPESLEFQGLLAEMASSGCDYVVTEVSSHSLAQRRVDYTRFIVVVFTNLTRDHLDFHGTMEEYYASKRRLFTQLLTREGIAVINVDDEWGRRLKAEIEDEVGVRRGAGEKRSLITYGTGREADVSAADIRESFSGNTFTMTYKGVSCGIDSPLLGMPNVYNALAAASVALALNVPLHVIEEGIRKVTRIEGRLETVDLGQDFLCVVDYAHTPDALERLLLSARSLLKNEGNPGSIITVFGCGGDRDKGKRPLMGEIATRLSDYAIITSDNPRSENPAEIIKDIMSGISRNNCVAVPDRREAIIKAIDMAETGDMVILAGKGHENYQEIKGTRYRFSDREIAEEVMRNKLKK